MNVKKCLSGERIKSANLSFVINYVKSLFLDLLLFGTFLFFNPSNGGLLCSCIRSPGTSCLLDCSDMVGNIVFLQHCVAFFKGRVSTDIGNVELWARGWRIYFSELSVSFKPQGKFFNSQYFEYPWAKSVPTGYRLYYSGYRLYPNTFQDTLNKNVNHSNDTIDNHNQSSFHKPARQCQGQRRTESLPAPAHILHCGVKYGLGWCGPAPALKIVRQLIFDNYVTFV